MGNLTLAGTSSAAMHKQACRSAAFETCQRNGPTVRIYYRQPSERNQRDTGTAHMFSSKRSMDDLAHATRNPWLAPGSFVPRQLGRYLSVAVHQHLLQVVIDVFVVPGDQRDCRAFLPCPSCPSNPVRVLFDGRRHVVIDHKTHIGDVDTAPRDVGRHQHIKLLATEAIQACLALVLSLSSVQNCGCVALPFQHLGHHVACALDVCKHDRLSPFREFQGFKQEARLIVLLAHLDNLRDIVGYTTRATDGDRDRMPQVRSCDPLHRGWHGGTEHQRGAIRLVLLQRLVFVLWLEVRGGHYIQDRIHLWFEAHVDHSVCFIQHHKIALVEDCIATIQAIHHAPWRGDHDLASLA
mmetsp:Transcript_6968/g.42648  ORF Transcript_6968/g.42648 Transcript_6968/m.42648 type:complete len:352 (-) Transcript_6968:1182-2237(-)